MQSQKTVTYYCLFGQLLYVAFADQASWFQPVYLYCKHENLNINPLSAELLLFKPWRLNVFFNLKAS